MVYEQEFHMDDIALLYARVSTQKQVDDGVSLDVQERSLRMAAELAGYKNVELIREEGRSGKSITGRPALRESLARLESGEAKALFVTRIDRLARSTQDFLSIIDHSQKYGWRLVMLDLNLDTSSSAGRFVVTIMSALAEMERSIIASRQKDIHKDRRDRGLVWGVDLGPKTKVSLEVLERIYNERDKGLSYHAIARGLNNDSIPTALGGEWHGSTVRKIIHFRKEERPETPR
jgi:DNA invertase Pin-like site-specific DNA recombinase